MSDHIGHLGICDDTFPACAIPAYAIEVESVTDVRSGNAITFSVRGCLEVFDLAWSDVARYGDKVLRVVMRAAGGPV